MSERLVVRSYARVFAVDRRIYRVDRWPLPVPGGVPLRGVVYFVVALVGVLIGGGLPAIGALLGELSPPFRYVIVPLGVAVLGTQAAPDGRSAHRFAWDWTRLQLRSRRRSAGRPVPVVGEAIPWHGVLPTVWDAGAPELRRGRVTGPARVEFAVPVRVLRRRRGRLLARGVDGAGAGDAVALADGEILEVR